MSTLFKTSLLFVSMILASGSLPAQAPRTGAPPSAQPGGAQKPAESASKAAQLPPEAPVITLEGFCPKATTPPPDCKTVVTKAEFERLTNALNPEMTDQVKRQLATSYGQVLLLATGAEQAGLADTPQARELLAFARLQALAQVLVRKTQADAENIPAAEIEKYYKDNEASYQEATMRRLFVPKLKPNSEQGGEALSLDETKVKAAAEKARTAAVAGQPFEQLQKDVYTQLELTMEPPPPDPVTITRDQMPETHIAAFDMKAGEVSQPFDQPGGIYIYKVDSKRTKPLEEVKPQIQQTMADARMQVRMVEITKGAEPNLNTDYFGEAPPQMPPGMMPQE
ncbi:MAG: peptidyl-prolyl cis-trans isomerase [Candidatus Korobacteraceae bacterium]